MSVLGERDGAELLDVDALLGEARAAQLRAYVPYSGFRVGAALLSADGTVFTGANVENAAYPATICAERVALPAAVVAGVREFRALAVVGDGDGPTTPCGMCRQVLFEFAPDLVVVAAGATGEAKRYVLGEDLLPDGFGPRRLRAGSGRAGQPGETTPPAQPPRPTRAGQVARPGQTAGPGAPGGTGGDTTA